MHSAHRLRPGHRIFGVGQASQSAYLDGYNHGKALAMHAAYQEGYDRGYASAEYDLKA